MTGRTFGHYRIVQQIGAGGMGVVCRARDTKLALRLEGASRCLWFVLVASLAVTGCGSSSPGEEPESPQAMIAEAPPEAAAPEAAPEVAPPPESDCRLHIEVHGSALWATELGQTEMWVLANHRINLWASQSPTKGQKVGELRVGSRAVVLAEAEEDYQVRSPLDDSVGWINKMQVARTLHQNVKTFEACTP